MSRLDIRLRRQRVTQGRIESHKNYSYLMELHREESKRKTRGFLVIVFMVIMAIVISIAIVRSCENRASQQTDTPSDTIPPKTTPNSPYDIAY
jgi:hypothetical protein